VSSVLLRIQHKSHFLFGSSVGSEGVSGGFLIHTFPVKISL
jgi:hypothetical protein